MFIFFKRNLYCVDATLNILSVVDVDMTVVVFQRTLAFGKILDMMLGRFGSILIVPLFDFIRYLRVNIAFLINKVGTFIHINDNVEKQIYI